MTEPTREKLELLRTGLLHLHKTLVDSEGATYSTTIGAIQSPNHFLQLLTTDAWFAWLKPLSQLIVAIDEALDEEQPFAPGDIQSWRKQTAQLLVAEENAEGFSGHYYAALQRDPDVVVAHGDVKRLLVS